MQLTLAASLQGLAVGQLAPGAISHRLGPRRPLSVGMLAYTVSSLLCAAAPSAVLLLAARLMTGATAASGVVIARALAIDLTGGERESARLLSLLMGTGGAPPIAAPVIGGALLDLGGWRTIFLALGAAGVPLCVCTVLTIPADQATTIPRQARSHIAAILPDRQFARSAAQLARASSILFTYVSAAPQLIERQYHVAPTTFSALFAINAAGLLLATILNRVALHNRTPRGMIKAGFAAQIVALSALAASIATHAPIALIELAMFSQTAPLGILLPNTAALALERYRSHTGTACALLGFTQFATGAAVSPLGTDAIIAALVGLSTAGLGLTLITFLPDGDPVPTGRSPGDYPAATDAQFCEVRASM